MKKSKRKNRLFQNFSGIFLFFQERFPQEISRPAFARGLLLRVFPGAESVIKN
ncbi:MAG: hypothetical protein IJQ62_05240 [Clostridia bacterium]|nr:hypothetical protein [Clostridia bacterium]